MLDISIVTDTLRELLLDALATSPLFGGTGPGFSVAVTGQHPGATATGCDCDLNLYLFYLTEDKHVLNQFWSQEFITGQPPGPPRQPVAFEPLCLDLFFLLSAESQTSYVQEQQVMSIALRALHEHATIPLPTPTPTGQPTSEITLTMERPTWDELSRLWQALNAPLRMTAQYKVSVVLITPESGAVAQPEPATWSVVAAPGESFGDGFHPHLVATMRRVTFEAPGGQRLYDQTPASPAPAPAAVPGQDLVLRGRSIEDTDTVFLVTHHPDGTETELDVTAWKVPLTIPYTSPPSAGVPVRLRPPDTPGVCPPPGRYTLRVGRPTDPGFRSNDVPVAIAPWVDPAPGPTITPAAGVFTCTVANVPATGAELRLGTVRLSRRTAVGGPAAGEWRLAGSTLRFRAPASLAAGQYAVRLRAADIEADPALWAVVP
jgi:hypothetical protein